MSPEAPTHASELNELFRAEFIRALDSDRSGNTLMSDYVSVHEQRHGAVGGSATDDSVAFTCHRAGGEFATVHVSWSELRAGWDSFLTAEHDRREVVDSVLTLIPTADLAAELARRNAVHY